MQQAQESIPPVFKRYVRLISSNVLAHSLETGSSVILDLFSRLDARHFEFRYTENKWTIREILMHLLDTERVMSFRALCIARGETREFPGFDENAYAQNYKNDPRNPEQLLREYQHLRTTTIELFEPFTSNILQMTACVNGSMLSVRTIGQIIAGHELHHKKILEERYFPNLM